MHANRTGTVEYDVDANAVADAILDRLFAGGALPHPPCKRR